MSERAGQYRVVVIGAGLSGLVTTRRILELAKSLRRHVEVILLEAKDRIGGAIWTNHYEGFTLEGGADSFITNKPWALELCRELELGDQLIGTDTKHRRSFVVRRGKLLPVPEGFVLMAPNRIGPILTTPTISWRGKLRMLMDLVIPRGTPDADESLASFVRRRLGREALDRLVQPLVGGIYTADPLDLSLSATLPQFQKMEQEHRSLILAGIRQARNTKAVDLSASGARYGLFVTLKDGMGTLPRTLAESLPGGILRLSTPVRKITKQESGSGGWRVELLNGAPIDADAVVVSTEAYSTARLLDGFDPELALHLRAIPYASSAVLNVAYRREQVAHPLDGFGVVVPRVENRDILAVSFTSVKFPSRAPLGTVLMRVFVGGATQPELFDYDDTAMRQMVRRELAELLGVKGDPLLEVIARHTRAMPQYTLGHMDRVRTIRRLQSRHSGLIIGGNAFDGVGVPDCVRAAGEAADATLASLVDPAKPAAA